MKLIWLFIIILSLFIGCSDTTDTISRVSENSGSNSQSQIPTAPPLSQPKFVDIDLNTNERKIRDELVKERCTGEDGGGTGTGVSSIKSAVTNFGCRVKEQEKWFGYSFLYEKSSLCVTRVNALKQLMAEILELSGPEAITKPDEQSKEVLKALCVNSANVAFINLNYKSRRGLGVPLTKATVGTEYNNVLKSNVSNLTNSTNNVYAWFRYQLWMMNNACSNTIKTDRFNTDNYYNGDNNDASITHYLMLKKLIPDVIKANKDTNKFSALLHKVAVGEGESLPLLTGDELINERIFYFRNWPRIIRTFGKGNRSDKPWRYAHISKYANSADAVKHIQSVRRITLGCKVGNNNNSQNLKFPYGILAQHNGGNARGGKTIPTDHFLAQHQSPVTDNEGKFGNCALPPIFEMADDKNHFGGLEKHKSTLAEFNNTYKPLGGLICNDRTLPQNCSNDSNDNNGCNDKNSKIISTNLCFQLAVIDANNKPRFKYGALPPNLFVRDTSGDSGHGICVNDNLEDSFRDLLSDDTFNNIGLYVPRGEPPMNKFSCTSGKAYHNLQIKWKATISTDRRGIFLKSPHSLSDYLVASRPSGDYTHLFERSKIINKDHSKKCYHDVDYMDICDEEHIYKDADIINNLRREYCS